MRKLGSPHPPSTSPLTHTHTHNESSTRTFAAAVRRVLRVSRGGRGGKSFSNFLKRNGFDAANCSFATGHRLDGGLATALITVYASLLKTNGDLRSPCESHVGVFVFFPLPPSLSLSLVPVAACVLARRQPSCHPPKALLLSFCFVLFFFLFLSVIRKTDD